MQQCIQGVWHPPGFFSHQLQPAETRYSTFDRELLAIHAGICHFRYFLDERLFVIFTDHKPLTFAMVKISDMWSSRQQRHLSLISEFTTNIHHVGGKDNFVADALSRVSAVDQDINFSLLAASQAADQDTQALRTDDTNLHFLDVPSSATSQPVITVQSSPPIGDIQCSKPSTTWCTLASEQQRSCLATSLYGEGWLRMLEIGLDLAPSANGPRSTITPKPLSRPSTHLMRGSATSTWMSWVLFLHPGGSTTS